MRVLRIFVLLFIFSFSFFIAGCSTDTSANSGGLIISEVVASNSKSIVDPVLGKPDWIELCNTSSNPIDLNGYSITESRSKKYTFPETTINAGGYLIVYCCTPPVETPSDKICTGFNLSKSGVNLILSSPGGMIQQLEIPALAADISYGITSDGKYSFFATPTPGAANTTKSFDSIDDLKSSADVKLKINEVMPQSASSSDPYGWVEIYNAGSSAVELSGYYLSENPSNPTKAQLPKNQLAAGGYAVIKFTGEIGDGQVPFKISKTENSLVLSNNFDTQIDKLSWDISIIPGISVGHGDNNTAVYYLTPTPGAPNGKNYITSISLTEGTGDIRINEVLLKNKYSITDSDGERFPWVELYNTTQSKVSLSGYALSDDKNKLMKWSFPDVSIDANSYLIVFLSGKNSTAGTDLHTNFKVGDQDTQLCLTNIKKGTVQTVNLPADRKDNVSYGLSSDGTWLFYSIPTPSAVNNSQGFKQISDINVTNPGLRINEVVSVNPAKSHLPDWVEIYNSSSKSVDLNGYYLSDSPKNLKKWPISNTNLKAGGYDVVDEYQSDSGTSKISVSEAGETLYLTNPSGVVIDSFDTGVLRPGYSSGITADGKQAIFRTPTKGAANSGDTVHGYCSEPVFSVPGGHQKGPVTLTITTSTQNADIYYTLDGSTPSESSSKYTGPISITNNITVKAIAIKSGMMDSDLIVATYLFDATHSLPVICLSISQPDLTYVSNSPSRDVKKERMGYVEYYEPDGSLGVKFPAGFRIAGSGTRLWKQRTFNLNLRGAYGQSSVTYPFFDGYNITNFKSLSLRHMGGWQDPSLLKDAFIHMATNGMNIDNMQTKFAAVYINGKYWGLYEFKENQNSDYLASKHKIDGDKVVMVRGDKYNTKTGHSDPDIVSLFNLASKDMNNPDNFGKYTNLTDSNYFMDYLIAETYFNCCDTYNQKYAHTTDNSLKWRPVFYDFDLSFKSASADDFNLFFESSYTRKAATSGQAAHVTNMSLYYAYYRNDKWRQQFVQRYAYVLNNILTTDKLLALFDNMTNSIKDEMPRTISQWNMPSSMSVWNSDVSAIRKDLQNRRSNILKQLKSYFNLSDSEMQQLFPNG